MGNLSNKNRHVLQGENVEQQVCNQHKKPRYTRLNCKSHVLTSTSISLGSVIREKGKRQWHTL